MAEEREAFLRVLRTVAPGTPLREGLESILRARTGALIVVGDSPQVMKLVNGGFQIDCELRPSSLYELAKMDGAIILTPDARRILHANTTLLADAETPSMETGIRHRTAERVARQTGELVISISQRRNVISLYKGTLRYVLQNIGVILAKANQALQTLEKYRTVLDRTLTKLLALELVDTVTVSDVAQSVQRSELVLRIVQEIEGYIAELGTEGRLVRMQLDELQSGVAEETSLILRDYIQQNEGKSIETVRDQLTGWPGDDRLELAALGRILGLGSSTAGLENPVSPRGYRILRRLPRLPMPVIENLVDHFGDLQAVLHASIEELDEVEGIGEVRAKTIRDGLRRLREQVMLERHD